MKLHFFCDDYNYEKLNDDIEENQKIFIEDIKSIVFPYKDEEEYFKYNEGLGEHYSFTYDNFKKMVMINLRVNAKVPLVIMGETGCGKTSLIRALANLKKADMIIFNIHAGIDNNKIIEFVKENNLLEKEENNFNKSYEKINDIWVFLDEVNTSNSLGLFLK